ncbi:MAG: hypothetical protein ACRYGF_01560 [Janthinobacterium lividum]
MAGADAHQATGDVHASFRARPEMCPCAPGAVLGHVDASSVPPRDMRAQPGSSYAAAAVQTECRWRIARDRSRQKRGPPGFILI